VTIRRRFIAGAKCPACGLEDKLRICTDDDPASAKPEWVECVRCDYTDVRPTEVTMKEPDEHHDEATGVVRFRP